MKYSDKIKDHAERLLSQSPDEQASEMITAIEKQEKIDTNTSFSYVEQLISKRNPFKVFINLAIKVAASLFIPLLALTVWSLTRDIRESGKEFAMQEISTQPGMRSQIVLPDGSKVWLNAESTIQYPIPFAENERLISLSGEAFFEVSTDEKRPMTINAGDSRIQVMGTSFNVKAYQNEMLTEVAMVSGKIKLSSLSKGTELDCRSLKPGEHAVLQNGTMRIESESLDKYISWRFGNLVLDETPLPELSRKLERWFGVEVIVKDDQLNSYRFTTTFINQSLAQVLELLELSSPISIDYQPGSHDKASGISGKGIVYISRKEK